MLFICYPKCSTCKKAKKFLTDHQIECEEEQLELLSTNGMLVKRPILETKDKVLVGFKEEQYKELL